MNVAIVSSAFGREPSLSSKSLAERVAVGLRAGATRVTVLATSLNFTRHDLGDNDRAGIRIIRFVADRRDKSRIALIEQRLSATRDDSLHVAATLGEIELDALIRNRLNSTSLLTYLARHIDEYDAIVFFDDYSGLTLRGWRIAADRTAVVSGIETRSDAYLLPTNAMMLGVGRIIFEDSVQESLARHIHGPGLEARSSVVGPLDGRTEESFDRLAAAIATIAAERGPTPRNETAHIVHYLASAEYADSTTLLALQFDTLLRTAGYRSSVVADDRDHRMSSQIDDPTNVLSPASLKIMYGDKPGVHVPASGAATMSFTGVLPECSMLDKPSVRIPPYLNIEAWSIEPSHDVFAALADGRTNLLCVGDVSPESRTLEVVEVFRNYVTLDFDSRLLLVGPTVDAAYLERVRRYIARCGLAGRVQVTGAISAPALVALYRTARVFVSLRDRFQTGLSLLEAMAFDIPLCLRDSEGSRAITGARTILFPQLASAFEIAALWRVVATDQPLRDRVVASQRSYLGSLTPERTRRALEEALGLSAVPALV